MNLYFKIVDKIWKGMSYFVGLLFFAMLCIVFWQVICRFVIKTSSGWTSETTILLFVYVIYFGAALAIHSGGQIAMTILLNKLQGKSKEILRLVTAALCELMYVLLAVSGIMCMQKFSATRSPGLGISMSWFYAGIGIAGCFMIILGIEDFLKPIQTLLGKGKEDKAL